MGARQQMTQEFAMKYMDEIVVWLDLDRMREKISPEGFNEEALRADMALMNR